MANATVISRINNIIVLKNKYSSVDNRKDYFVFQKNNGKIKGSISHVWRNLWNGEGSNEGHN